MIGDVADGDPVPHPASATRQAIAKRRRVTGKDRVTRGSLGLASPARAANVLLDPSPRRQRFDHRQAVPKR